MDKKPLEEPEFQWIEDTLVSLASYGLAILFGLFTIIKNLVIAACKLMT